MQLTLEKLIFSSRRNVQVLIFCWLLSLLVKIDAVTVEVNMAKFKEKRNKCITDNIIAKRK